jgi:ribose 5-phosphate isomerase A
MSRLEEERRRAAEKALSMLKAGMTVGLGTGSTVAYLIEKIPSLDFVDTLTFLPTSVDSEKKARSKGLKTGSINDHLRADIAIDGADEIDPSLDLVKGGGGALFREKVIASASEVFVVIADSSKLVDRFSLLPVEVLPFSWRFTLHKLSELNIRSELRLSGPNPYITDNSNYILDLDISRVKDQKALEMELKSIPGVIETGLFIGFADVVLVGETVITSALR